MKRLHALLVGINTYENAVISTLAGCINDLAQVQTLLNEYTSFEPNFLVYKNENATRANLIAALQTVANTIQIDDVFVFYFSGHGAEEATEIKDWGEKIEGFVCHDSLNTADVPLLANKEFRYLLQPIATRAAHTLVITDCCHSGEITRNLVARKLAKILPARNWQNFVFSDAFSPTNIADLPISKHIHIAACEHNKLAYEDKGAGVLTQNLVKIIRATKGKISYQSLKERLLLVSVSQRPNVEAYAKADITLNFLTTERLAQANETTLQYSNDRKKWLLGTGAQQNILSKATTESTEFLLFKNEIQQKFTIKIEAIEDTVTTVFDNEKLDKNTVYTVLINGSYPPLPIFIEGGNAQALQKVKQSFESLNKKNTYNIKLVEKTEASYFVVVNGSSFSPAAQIFDSKNPNLPLCDTVFDPPVLWQHFGFIQKWQRICNFQNANTAWKTDSLPLKLEVFTKINNTETLLSPSAENFYTIKESTALNIRLTNTDGRKLFLGAAFLSAQFGMTKLLLPQTSIDEKGKTVHLFGEKPTIMTIAEHRKAQPQSQQQPTETHIYKLIFSTKNIDISTWEQADLPAPKTTKKVMRSESRGFSIDMFDEMYTDDWATLNLEFLVV